MPMLASWLRGYRPSWLGADALAGVTTAAVVIPQAMAYATIAGLPLQHGLYCALVPMAVYALLGSSRPLSVSTTSTISLITAAAIASAPAGSNAAEAASLVAIEAGAALFIAGVFRLGFISDFISRPVLAGFKIGMGLTIAASQLGKILGIDVEGRTFFPKVWSAIQNLGDTSWWTLALAAVSFAILLVLKRTMPRIPGPLVVLALGMILIVLTSLEARGVSTVPPVPSGLPTPAVPDLDLALDMLPAGLGVGLMAFVESISAARAFRRPHDPPVDPDRELLALGAANVAGGFFRSYGAGGGLSQTAVNDDAGAKTQASELVTAAVVAMILVFFASLVADIPEATLGAIVLVAAIGLIDVAGLRALGRVRTDELAFGSITAASVLMLGTLAGLLVGVVVSLLSLFHHLNQPPIRVLGRQPGTERYRDLALHPDGETEPGLLIVRVEAPLYFGNAQRVIDRIAGLVTASTPVPDVLLLDASAVIDVDTTAIAVLRERAERLAAAGTRVWFAAMTDTVLLTARRTPRWTELDERGDTFPRVHDAVEAFRARSNLG